MTVEKFSPHEILRTWIYSASHFLVETNFPDWSWWEKQKKISLSQGLDSFETKSQILANFATQLPGETRAWAGGLCSVSSLSRMWSDDDLIDCDLRSVCASDTITAGCHMWHRLYRSHQNMILWRRLLPRREAHPLVTHNVVITINTMTWHSPSL